MTVVLPRMSELLEDRAEAGTPISRIRREVGASKKRFQLRSEPDRHRPSAAPCGCLNEEHVDPINVGPFLTIHFDGHIITIQYLSNALVLKGFVCHDMTPVASRIANRQENRLIFVARLIESRFPPRQPSHGI